MDKNVLIVGGGIIGLTTAYYLDEAGHRVTIIDRRDFLSNCSTGNAGLIVPSHFVPLASPGIVRQGIKWIFDSKSPFSMNFKPDFKLVKWGISFWRASNRENVRKSGPVLFSLSSFSKELYKSLLQSPEINADYQERGLLMLCHSSGKADEEANVGLEANRLGIRAEVLNPEQIKEILPHVEFNVSGGVYYPSDASIFPKKFLESLIKKLKSKNVELLSSHTLLDLQFSGNKASKALTDKGNIEFDELVIAGGVQSQKIFNKLKISTLIQAGKGYSFDCNPVEHLDIPLILVDARVAVTPFDHTTRFAGAMEIGGIEKIIKKKKIEGMVESINKFMPQIGMKYPATETIWSGLRPCSVDGLPYIGRLKKYNNVIVATGHSMMGVSLAPATGKLVEELISGKKTSLDLEPFYPER